jgi:hypothetical protein
VAGRPLLPVSTDFQTLDTLVDRLRSIAAKSPPKQTQSVADRLPLGPLRSLLIFSGIPNVLIIS